MGLFDFLKKSSPDGNMVKLTDFFSAEDMKEVKDLISHNRMGAHYRTVHHQTAAKTMIGYMSNPNKAYSPDKMGAFVSTAETIMVMEPSLKPILERGIARIQGTEEAGSADQSITDIREGASGEDATQTPGKELVMDNKAAMGKEKAPDKEDLLKAIDQSDLSYEEVMTLLKEKKQS